jgi:hypothetical protein
MLRMADAALELDCTESLVTDLLSSGRHTPGWFHVASELERGQATELVPGKESKRLEIDLYGSLAGILTLAANRSGPLRKSDPSAGPGGFRSGLGLLAGEHH